MNNVKMDILVIQWDYEVMAYVPAKSATAIIMLIQMLSATAIQTPENVSDVLTIPMDLIAKDVPKDFLAMLWPSNVLETQQVVNHVNAFR